MKRNRSFSIVVAGSGPVGLMTAALTVAGRQADDIDVQVLDAGGPPVWDAAQTDLRVYALSRASQALFERVGVWGDVQARRFAPYRQMRVWQGADPYGPGSLQFDAAEIGEPDLGTIVEDSLLRTVLLEYLDGAPKVTVRFGTALTQLDRAAGRIRLRTAAGDTLSADLVVGADGAASAVRGLAGIERIRRPYGQRAIVAHVESDEPHRETAWQRFGGLGPLALLPLDDGRSTIVWSVVDDEAERLEHLDAAGFGSELTAASAAVLGQLSLASRRASFPLTLVHACRYVDQSVAIIGDAAHAVHPLAGQGLNLGLLDAGVLVDVVSSAIAAGEYAGDRYVLDRFARRRRAHNVGMQLAFDAIDRVFRRTRAAPVRALGMWAIDSAPPVKRALITRAMGLNRLGIRRE